MLRSRRWVCVGVVAGAGLLGGCASSEKATVSFSYVVQPEKGMPPGMKTIAIQPATVGATTDEKWSDMCATLLQNLVNESRTRYNTDVVVSDRRDTNVTFTESDLRASGMSTAKGGGEGGKLLAAQGVIVSNINVKVEKHSGSQRTISGIDVSGLWGDHVKGGGVGVETSEVETVTRNMTVQTDFRLLDTANNKVWDQWSTTHSSTDRTKASPFFGRGMTEAELTPQDRITGTLVERGAREFLSRLMPVRIDVEEEVQSSSSAHSVRGVKLLRGEQYEDALTAFATAVDENPGDHRSAFGAGVAAEAAGKFDRALKYYQQAAQEQENRTYKEARDRVKTYGQRARNG